jgi:diguanylate cyclase (GGDEF)-like protein
MISLKNTVGELEACYNVRDLALDSYALAIRNIAQYSIDLDPEVTAAYKGYLEDLARTLRSPTPNALDESRATLRGLLRDYRDKVGGYMSQLREELSGSAQALQQILESLGQTDGDHEQNLHVALSKIRAAPLPSNSEAANIIQGAARHIEQSLEQVRKQHQFTVSQFLMEIRMLHKRIDSLESAARVDQLTALFTRQEMEARIRERKDVFTLLLIKAGGFKTAEIQHGKEVAEELTGAFSRRLRNSLPSDAAIGRWGHEEFLAILKMDQPAAAALARKISEGLTGPYACLKAGKTVRPALQLRIALVEKGNDPAEKILQRANEFLNL